MSNLLGNYQALFHPWEWPGILWNETLDLLASVCSERGLCELKCFGTDSGNLNIFTRILTFQVFSLWNKLRVIVEVSSNVYNKVYKRGDMNTTFHHMPVSFIQPFCK